MHYIYLFMHYIYFTVESISYIYIFIYYTQHSETYNKRTIFILSLKNMLKAYDIYFLVFTMVTIYTALLIRLLPFPCLSGAVFLLLECFCTIQSF